MPVVLAVFDCANCFKDLHSLIVQGNEVPVVFLRWGTTDIPWFILVCVSYLTLWMLRDNSTNNNTLKLITKVCYTVLVKAQKDNRMKASYIKQFFLWLWKIIKWTWYIRIYLLVLHSVIHNAYFKYCNSVYESLFFYLMCSRGFLTRLKGKYQMPVTLAFPFSR